MHEYALLRILVDLGLPLRQRKLRAACLGFPGRGLSIVESHANLDDGSVDVGHGNCGDRTTGSH